MARTKFVVSTHPKGVRRDDLWYIDSLQPDQVVGSLNNQTASTDYWTKIAPSSAAPGTRTHFLSLPAELRLKIYDLVFASYNPTPQVIATLQFSNTTRTIAISQTITTPETKPEPLLLQVCHEIRNEAMQPFFFRALAMAVHASKQHVRLWRKESQACWKHEWNAEQRIAGIDACRKEEKVWDEIEETMIQRMEGMEKEGFEARKWYRLPEAKKLRRKWRR